MSAIRSVRSGARLISAVTSRSAFIPSPSLCNAALQVSNLQKLTATLEITVIQILPFCNKNTLNNYFSS